MSQNHQMAIQHPVCHLLNSKNPTKGCIQHVTYLILMLEIILKKEEALRKHAKGTPTMMCMMKILQELQLFFFFSIYCEQSKSMPSGKP